MANKTVSVNNLNTAIKAELNEFYKLTDEGMKKAVNTTANETRKTTRDNSPVLTGAYRKGWNTKQGKGGRLGYSRIVYNGPEYRLTHLLQKGHGGPHPARAFPHIPSDEETEKLLIRHLREEIEG